MVMGRPLRARKPTKPPRPSFGGGGVTRRAAVAVMAAAVRQAMGASASVSVSISDPAALFAWLITEGQTLSTYAGGSIPIATNAAGLTVRVDPDLPPGHSLVLSGGALNVNVASDVPSYIDVPDTWVFTAQDSPIATVVNVTQGITYNYSAPGTWPSYGGQASNRWNAVIGQAAHGDIIEISPGAVHAEAADCVNYWANSLNATGLVLVKGGTIRSMSGMGRWRVWPVGYTPAYNQCGVVIYSPTECGGRQSFAIEGFDLTDQFGTTRDAYGVRMRNESAGSTWNGVHSSVTLRNFKIGNTSGITSSGISNGAETLLIENGHLFDCGQSGYEHNAYISGRNLTLRGVRSSRSRNNGYAGGMDGHCLKVAGETVLVEGCVVEGLDLADNSALVHFYHGGACTIRSSLLIQGATPSSAKGMIWYEEQDGPYSQPPPWWYGAQGHSLLLEKNVFISRAVPTYTTPEPAIAWFATGLGAVPISGGNLVVRDNIAAIYSTPSSSWFSNPPRSVNWASEGNSIESYDATDSAFTQTALKKYLRAAGPISGNALATQRFVYPHGYTSRSDSARGLG